MRGALLLLLVFLLIVVLFMVVPYGRDPESPIEKARGYARDARRTAVIAEKRSIETAATLFYAREGRFAESIGELVDTGDISGGAMTDPRRREYRLAPDYTGQMAILAPGDDGIFGTADDWSEKIQGFSAPVAARKEKPPEKPKEIAFTDFVYPTPTPKILPGGMQSGEGDVRIIRVHSPSDGQ